MATLGEYLKKAREQKGISIQEVSLTLKISVRVLHAIETDDVAALPARTFVRGFVRSYAQYLELDPQNALHLFNQRFGLPPTPDQTQLTPTDPAPPEVPAEATTLGPSAPERPPVLTKPKPRGMPHKSGIENKFILFGVLISVIVVSVGLIRLVSKYQSERVIPPNADNATERNTGIPSEPIASPTPETTAEVLSSTQPPANVTPIEELVLKASPPQNAEIAAPTSSDSTPAPTPTPAPVPKPVAAAAPTSEPVATSAEPPSAEGLATEIIIDALNPVTINYSAEGKPTQQVSLNGNEIITIKAVGRITLTLSDGGAASVIVNGLARKTGENGQPLTLQLP